MATENGSEVQEDGSCATCSNWDKQNKQGEVAKCLALSGKGQNETGSTSDFMCDPAFTCSQYMEAKEEGAPSPDMQAVPDDLKGLQAMTDSETGENNRFVP